MENFDDDQFSSQPSERQPAVYASATQPRKRSYIKWLIGLLLILLVIVGGIWMWKAKKSLMLNPTVTQQASSQYLGWVTPPPPGFPPDLPLDPARQMIGVSDKVPATASTTAPTGAKFYEVIYFSRKTVDQTIQEFRSYFNANGWQTRIDSLKPAGQAVVAAKGKMIIMVNIVPLNNNIRVNINFVSNP